jgi:acyl carrier protein
MVQTLSRHFEAEAPSMLAPITDPIPCSRVLVSLGDVDRALATVSLIKDFALRFTNDSIEGFLSIDAGSRIDSGEVKMALARVLPGYSIPDTLHILDGVPLARDNGQVNFEILQQQVSDAHNSGMDELELLVRDIFADLLSCDPNQFDHDSDFFLLGGTSLLLGKLSYYIRKQTGTSVPVVTLFNRSTIKGIAGLIEEEENLSHLVAGGSTNDFDDCDRHVKDSEILPSQDQIHPLNLIVQALPMIFYPLKAALICECH